MKTKRLAMKTTLLILLSIALNVKGQENGLLQPAPFPQDKYILGKSSTILLLKEDFDNELYNLLAEYSQHCYNDSVEVEIQQISLNGIDWFEYTSSRDWDIFIDKEIKKRSKWIWIHPTKPTLPGFMQWLERRVDGL